MDVLGRWRHWIRPTFFLLCCVGIIVALPLSFVEFKRAGAPAYVEAWFIGGLFALLSMPISMWGITQHLYYYTQPDLQKHIIRVLWMVPIYAMNAWLALRFPAAAIYLDTMRECYEAYVIYNFMRYLLNYLYKEHPHLEQVLEQRRRVKHFIPFCCLPPWPRGEVFLNRCKYGVLQYAVVRPTMTVIALICELAGSYDEGNFNFKSGWSYIVIINNVSQVWAVYCLLLFYRGTKQELAPIRPVPKFLCVKAVVFMAFWQSVVIALLVNMKVIPEKIWVFYDGMEAVAMGLQDFLICVEMFLFAIAFDLSFPYHPFMQGVVGTGDCFASCMTMWDVSDVRDDIVDYASYLGQGARKVLGRRRVDTESSELTPLLSAQTSGAPAALPSFSSSPSQQLPDAQQRKENPAVSAVSEISTTTDMIWPSELCSDKEPGTILTASAGLTGVAVKEDNTCSGGISNSSSAVETVIGGSEDIS